MTSSARDKFEDFTRPALHQTAGGSHGTRGRPRATGELANTELHVRCLVRCAAWPRTATTITDTPETARLTGLLLEKRAEYMVQRMDLSERMAAVVPAINDPTHRREWLALRRSLYNCRASSNMPQGDWPAAAAAIRHSVAAAVKAVQEIGRLEEAMRRAHASEIERAEERLLTAANAPDFRRSLWLSSESLASDLERCWSGNLQLRHAAKRRLGAAVMRYLSRASHKATPFARFCRVAWATPHGLSDLNHRCGLMEGPAFLAPNRSVIAAVLERIRRDPTLLRQFPVTLTDTLWQDRAYIGWIEIGAKEERAHRAARSAILDALIVSAHGGSLTPGALQRQIASRLACDPANLKDLLEILCQRGLLVYQLPFEPWRDDWPEQLIALLARSHNAESLEVARELRAYAAVVAELRAAPADRTATLMKTARRSASAVCDALQISVPRFVDLPVLEDAAVGGTLRLSVRHSESEALELLREYVRLTLSLGAPLSAAETAYEYVTARHRSTMPVPLTQLVQSYFQDCLTRQLRLRAQLAGGASLSATERQELVNPLNVRSIAKRYAAREALRQLVARAIAAAPAAPVVSIGMEDIAAIARETPSAWQCERVSISVLCNCIAGRKDQPACIVTREGGWSVGHGKYYSRFLRVLPPAATTAIRAGNEDWGAVDLAELADRVTFNPNDHPPLTAVQIVYGGHPTPPGVRPVLVRDVDVTARTYENGTGRLILVERGKEREIRPIDLGFIAGDMRSPVQQFLYALSPPSGFRFPMPRYPRDLYDRGDEHIGVVEHWPRVTIEGRLILSRRKWRVRAAATTVWRDGQSGAGAYAAIRAWQRANDVPEQVYVRFAAAEPENIESLAAGSAAVTATPERDTVKRRIGKDAQKPQFVDFHNAALVGLLVEQVRAAPTLDVIMEECLPLPKDAGWVDLTGYATEENLEFTIEPRGGIGASNAA